MDNRNAVLVLMGAAFFVAGFYFFGDNLWDWGLAALGLVLFAAGYLSGFFAFALGILFSVFYFLVSLPVISSLYVWLIFVLSKIHYILFTVIVKKILRRMKWYRDLEFRVKNNRSYIRLSASTDRFLKRLGLKSPPAVQILQVKTCNHCNKTIPADSRFCPYCGKRVEENPTKS